MKIKKFPHCVFSIRLSKSVVNSSISTMWYPNFFTFFSPSDARLKQQIADKLLDLMKTEEDKLGEQPRRISTQLGVRPDFLDEDETPTRRIASEADEPDDGGAEGHQEANTHTNEDLSSLPGKGEFF